ncbi:ribosomal L7Ae/L30e/S12e/Gadd45 family protein [Lactobacillus sp. ESL0684]|uniref:L7Ae/L30e/S12e/Gadd45 family ribosomal protein n=1 Tax=unclassified Lactobacillus TaxID=2620435 RepID=UPI0023F7F626|nr:MULTISPECIES: ribosomal L7Ae/L30e/S12e/Gadd45 family protein [unclassified Lactobacillus]WEV40801.1 ribosomal L7Ae/L30e/S12e/Gadd45 family protein [Lactobacillus sp. ESL0681]WEV44368.1 ribosomal L7Ae/L30e/S12e/Gadd45 family protein [Lactobacillus sp. ESL0684]
MQNKQQALNLLGLAQKAGKIISGFDLVSAGLTAKQVKIVILANDSHDDTREKITRNAVQNQVDVISSFTSMELSQAIGKNRKVLGLTDRGFSRALVQKINEGV